MATLDRPLTFRTRHGRFTVRHASLMPAVLRYVRTLDAVVERRECGANAEGGGGFQAGNTCGKGEGGGGGNADASEQKVGNDAGEPSHTDLNRVFRDVSADALSLSKGSDPEQVRERAEIKKQVTKAVLDKLDKIGMDEDSVTSVLLRATGWNNSKFSEGAPEGYEKRHALVRGVIDTWASTSGDSEPVAVGIQMAIAKELSGDVPGLSDATTSHLGKYEQSFPNDVSRLRGIEEIVANSSAIREVIRAQYNATQDYFESQGIKEVTLHRGFISETSVKSSDSEDLSLQPASSFSMNRKTAKMFADDLDSSISGIATVTVPVSRILCTARTGMGCITEQEVVVLGGKIKGKVVAGGQRPIQKGAAAAKLKALMLEKQAND